MKYDGIHYWTEAKLDIVKEYALAYSTILSAQKRPLLCHVYIDAFAGAGLHVSKSTGQSVSGSPLNALLIEPPFREYHLIDLDSQKTDMLRQLTEGYTNVNIYEGDCNTVLLKEVFPRVRYEDYRRGLCLLDPCGLHLDWTVIQTASQAKSIEIFLNFPVMDMNRNVLWDDPKGVDPEQATRMTEFWGDESWRQAAYDTTGNLSRWEEKQGNEAVAEAFRQRLKKVAGFTYVPDPMPMRNSKNAIVYYLFFASHKPVAADIVTHIFDKNRNRGVI